MEQRSDEWFKARLGKLTASRIADATARTKTGWSESRDRYMCELIAERLSGQPANGYTNAAMQWGTEQEPNAIAAYEFERNITISPVGFVDHKIIIMAGASPDGLVGDEGLIEVKCPQSNTHFATLEGAPIDGKYIKQMQFQMACTGRQWCDFVSYDPRMPLLSMQLHVRRLQRDNAIIEKLEFDAMEFLAELDERESRFRKRYK